jgi:hypothetical protein
MDEIDACLAQAHVTLRYIPPKNPQPKKDCKATALLKPPIVSVLKHHQDTRLLCAIPQTEGAGAIVLLAQVSANIEWEILFKNTFNMPTREVHAVFASFPVMVKLPGPRIALMAVTPMYLKLPVYAGMAYRVFSRIEEMERVLKVILKLQKGYCSDDIKGLESGLRAIEQEGNQFLWRARQNRRQGPEELAWLMRNKQPGEGLFAGARVA